MEQRVANLEAAVSTLLDLVERYRELVDAAYAAGLQPAVLSAVEHAETEADLPSLRELAGARAC